ncbi:MAG TPA: Hsp20/alpha crystallin family protein [Ktedonobacteraceae bacterium]|nr:Hsp20/alpha crystallin family protein [Ktedonobacteraceae bacterium]
MSMLQKKDPFEALVPLREAMNRLFEESFFWPGRLEFFTGRTFPVDVIETEDKQQYTIKASLPGFKPEDIQITAEGDTLTIRVAKKGEEKEEKPTYVRHERYEGEMIRSFTLPGRFEADQIAATYEHGVLSLTVPKAEAIKPKQIPITVKEAVGAR